MATEGSRVAGLESRSLFLSLSSFFMSSSPMFASMGEVEAGFRPLNVDPFFLSNLFYSTHSVLNIWWRRISLLAQIFNTEI